MIRTLKYVRQYFRPAPAAVDVLPTTYRRGGQELRGVIYRPRSFKPPGSAWIVLHGLTYKGAQHPGLQRFSSALCASGHLVFIPEIPEWMRLVIAPELTRISIKAAAEALRARDDVDTNRIGVFGFSFGATQGVAAMSDPEIAKHFRAMVAWGGYADIARLVHFGLTGEHDLDGVREHIDPDPYGRWIFGANYLTSIPGYENMTGVTDALMDLAQAAGKSGLFAGDPIHNPLKQELANRLQPDERAVFKLFAPVDDAPDTEAAYALSKQLAATIVAKDPLMDPGPYLDTVRVPILLAHGRDDRLVPYTESLRMRRRLPGNLVAGCTITSLFAHSGGTEKQLGPLGLGREAIRFLAVLNRIIGAL